MKNILVLSLLVMLPVVLSGCNTMAGAGEDISKGGKAIERSADDNNNY